MQETNAQIEGNPGRKGSAAKEPKPEIPKPNYDMQTAVVYDMQTHYLSFLQLAPHQQARIAAGALPIAWIDAPHSNSRKADQTEGIHHSSNQKPKSLKKQVKDYFFASLIPQNKENLESLQKEILIQTAISRTGKSDPSVSYSQQLLQTFYKLLQEREEKWEFKLVQAEEALEKSQYVLFFVERMNRKKCPWAISSSQMRNLLGVFLSMVLQNVSILTGKNHLKEQDMALLEELLENESHLKSCRKRIERPFVQAARGKLKPNSDEYLTEVLVRVQLLSQFYVDLLHGFEGRMELCVQLLESLSDMSWQDQEVLLHHRG